MNVVTIEFDKYEIKFIADCVDTMRLMYYSGPQVVRHIKGSEDAIKACEHILARLEKASKLLTEVNDYEEKISNRGRTEPEVERSSFVGPSS